MGLAGRSSEADKRFAMCNECGSVLLQGKPVHYSGCQIPWCFTALYGTQPLGFVTPALRSRCELSNNRKKQNFFAGDEVGRMLSRPHGRCRADDGLRTV